MAKKKIPESVHTKGAKYLYTIQIVSYPINVFEVSELSDSAVAEWIPMTHEIYVTGPAPSAQAQVDREMHEILHAMCTVALPLKSRLSELQVNTLSLVLVDFFKRNPHFTERFINLVKEK